LHSTRCAFYALVTVETKGFSTVLPAQNIQNETGVPPSQSRADFLVWSNIARHLDVIDGELNLLKRYLELEFVELIRGGGHA
jgi:hypothetical protein